MVSLHNLKPEKVIKAFERAGWTNRGFSGSHVKLTKEGNPKLRIGERPSTGSRVF